MNNFKTLSEMVLKANSHLIAQKLTVEKEIIHQDILRIMNAGGYLTNLTFIGGTCLRLCYGFARLSEDLDFSSSVDFKYSQLESMEKEIKSELNKKYGTDIEISRPEKDTDTDTWIIKVITHPEQSHLPSQKVHIDICHYPSYERQLRQIKDVYGITENQSQLFVFSESLQEILIDKLIAFAQRNRIKNRDLWDIMKLNEKSVSLNKDLLKNKLSDKKISFDLFSERFSSRINELKQGYPSDFIKELERFVDKNTFNASILSQEQGLLALTTVLADYKSDFLK